jgi:cardiolipin synthase
MNMERVTLIKDGRNAFPLLMEEMKNAEKTVFLRMFIWRNDSIGKKMAEAILEAADRGVKVTIVKDRYGMTCEYMEEDCTSMFHPDMTLQEAVWVRSLQCMYHPELLGKEHLHEFNPLRERMRSHPNIDLRCDDLRRDHSKLFIFDQRIMVFGGVNIEDKENGADAEGRVYHDYMVRLEGEDFVRLYNERCSGCFSKESSMFGMNIKETVRVFEMKQRYLSLIHNAKKELTILMAYFSPVKEILDAIRDAMRRGVKVTVMIPKKANVSDDITHKTMSILFRHAMETNADFTVCLHPGMPHTKLLMNESEISLGSCNITRNAFGDLSELNYFAANDDSQFAIDVRESAAALLGECERAKSLDDLSCSPLRAAMEGITL